MLKTRIEFLGHVAGMMEKKNEEFMEIFEQAKREARTFEMTKDSQRAICKVCKEIRSLSEVYHLGQELIKH